MGERMVTQEALLYEFIRILRRAHS